MEPRDPLIIWSISRDGKQQALCTIELDEFYQDYVSAALTFYKTTVTAGSRLLCEINHTAGLGTLPAWRDVSASIIKEHLLLLAKCGVSDAVCSLIQENLDLEHSVVQFTSLLHDRFAESVLIPAAYDMARNSHISATYARPQDREGFFNVPYLQHPRNIAIQAMRLSLNERCIVLALLHDVIEDSELPQEETKSVIMERFGRELTDDVTRLTRATGQSREDFLSQVSGLSGDLAVVKTLDRYDNLIRAFGIRDPQYHLRILQECESTYDQFLDRQDVLNPLKETYYLVKHELARYREGIRGNTKTGSSGNPFKVTT